MSEFEKPIELNELGAVIESSRAGRTARRLASTLAAAWSNSQLMRVARMGPAARGVATTIRVAAVGWTVAIAVIAHLVLLLVGEPYRYPSRAAMALPLILVAAGVLCVLLRHPLARGLDHRGRHE